MCCVLLASAFRGEQLIQDLQCLAGPLKGGAVSVCRGGVASRVALLCCRHMVLLKEQYGKQVVVNLLGSRGGEEVLNRAFKVTGFPAWEGRE